MVSIQDIRTSNNLFSTSPTSKSLTAVFVGATSGIGLSTLRAFTLKAQTPKIYILGRSLQTFNPLLASLRLSNSDAVFEFIETEISLIRNVDAACRTIISQEEQVDVLFMSPGKLQFGGRDETDEGLDIPHSLRYFARLRFVYNLLPLLLASPRPRVVSILGGGLEKKVDLEDIEVKNEFSAMKAAAAGTTLTTLSLSHLSTLHPSLTLLHAYPGLTPTTSLPTLLMSTTGILYLPALVTRYTLLPLINLFFKNCSLEEAGERGLYLSTSEEFERGVWRVGAKGDVTKPKEGDGVWGYGVEGAGEKVWKETVEVWERVVKGASEGEEVVREVVVV